MISSYKKGSAVKLSKNFKSTEFDCHGKGCCDKTQVSSELVDILQKIRNHFGRAVTLNSAYRCQKHNRAVGGASRSRHLSGMAADIVVSGIKPAEVAKYAESIGVRGIGLYETDSDGYFVHIDTRAVAAYWYGSAEKPRSSFGGANPYPVPKKNLALGSSGDAVRWLQVALTAEDCSCGEVDGIFGRKTLEALLRYQRKCGLDPDGICGPLTRAALEG